MLVSPEKVFSLHLQQVNDCFNGSGDIKVLFVIHGSPNAIPSSINEDLSVDRRHQDKQTIQKDDAEHRESSNGELRYT